MALVPMLVVLWTARQKGIIGPKGRDKDVRSGWAEEIAKWVNEFEGLPDIERKVKVDDEKTKTVRIKGYGKAMGRLARFYFALIARLGLVAGTEEAGKKQEVFDRIEKELKEDLNMTIDKKAMI
jgi:hypothetical protein